MDSLTRRGTDAPTRYVTLPEFIAAVGPAYISAAYTANGAVSTTFVNLSGWTVVESTNLTAPGTGAAFTITTPGRYLLNATIVFDAIAGAARAARFVINGTALPYSGIAGAGTSAFTAVTLSRIERLSAGDIVNIQAFASASVNVLGGTSGYGQTRADFQRISA